MKFAFVALLTAFFSLFSTACIQSSDEQYEVDNFQVDNESHYREYDDDDFIPDEDIVKESWDVNFSFLGTINDGNSDDINYGGGILTYIDQDGNSMTLNQTWVIKKFITLNSENQIPMFQVFFAEDSSQADDSGWLTYFILQIEASSLSKSETYYLNNDKIYKTKVRLNSETGKIEEICYLQEPDPTTGRVILYTSNIRIGEEFRVEGYADMKDMEVEECKIMD